MGVPIIGCTCPVCTSADPRNKRTRTSALVEADGTAILIDAGPDLRTQMLRHDVRRLDAVLITHTHADHIGGIDDLRPFTMHSPVAGLSPRPLPIYGDESAINRIRHQFDYAFDPAPSLSTRPALITRLIDGPFTVGTLAIVPFAVYHGPHKINGYRFGRCAYLTDGKSLPPETLEQLRGLDLLVMNALRYKDHPLHFTVDEALAVVDELRPRQTLLVHMTHDLEHATVNAELPPYIQLAYDGQVVELAD